MCELPRQPGIPAARLVLGAGRQPEIPRPGGRAGLDHGGAQRGSGHILVTQRLVPHELHQLAVEGRADSPFAATRVPDSGVGHPGRHLPEARVHDPIAGRAAREAPLPVHGLTPGVDEGHRQSPGPIRAPEQLLEDEARHRRKVPERRAPFREALRRDRRSLKCAAAAADRVLRREGQAGRVVVGRGGIADPGEVGVSFETADLADGDIAVVGQDDVEGGDRGFRQRRRSLRRGGDRRDQRNQREPRSGAAAHETPPESVLRLDHQTAVRERTGGLGDALEPPHPLDRIRRYRRMRPLVELSCASAGSAEHSSSGTMACASALPSSTPH